MRNHCSARARWRQRERNANRPFSFHTLSLRAIAPPVAPRPATSTAHLLANGVPRPAPRTVRVVAEPAAWE
jgi:hypothetical protein